MTIQETTQETKKETQQKLNLKFIIDNYAVRYNYKEYKLMTNSEKIKFLEKEYVLSEEYIRDLEKWKDKFKEQYRKAKDKLEQIKEITK